MHGSSCSSISLAANSSTLSLSVSERCSSSCPEMFSSYRCFACCTNWSCTVWLTFSSSLMNSNSSDSKPLSGLGSFEINESAWFVTALGCRIYVILTIFAGSSWICEVILWLKVPTRHSKLPVCTGSSTQMSLVLMWRVASKKAGSSSINLKSGLKNSSWLSASPLASSAKISCRSESSLAMTHLSVNF